MKYIENTVLFYFCQKVGTADQIFHCTECGPYIPSSIPTDGTCISQHENIWRRIPDFHLYVCVNTVVSHYLASQ